MALEEKFRYWVYSDKSPEVNYSEERISDAFSYSRLIDLLKTLIVVGTSNSVEVGISSPS